MKRLVQFFLVLVALFTGSAIASSVPVAHAASVEWYVTQLGSDSDDCLSPETACQTINGAIAKASSGDTIKVAVATYMGSGDYVVTLNKSVALSGGWDNEFTAQTGLTNISGQNARVELAVMNDAVASIDRFRLQNGWGGIIIFGSDLTVTNSIITNNSNNGDAAINNNGGTLILDHSTISDNDADGISSGGYLTVSNSTISGNAYSGISKSGPTTVIINSTITDNNMGIYILGTDVTLQGSIVSQNHTADCTGSGGVQTLTSLGYNVFGKTSSSCTYAAGTNDKINVTPKLGELRDNGGPTLTHALLVGSPAIDLVPNTVCPSPDTDQRGLVRPINGDQSGPANCDAGAFEYDPTAGCAAMPSKPALQSPVPNASTAKRRIQLKWKQTVCAGAYIVTVRQNTKHGPLAQQVGDINVTQFKTQKLAAGKYYWRIEACNDFGCKPSAWRMFTVTP